MYRPAFVRLRRDEERVELINRFPDAFLTTTVVDDNSPLVTSKVQASLQLLPAKLSVSFPSSAMVLPRLRSLPDLGRRTSSRNSSRDVLRPCTGAARFHFCCPSPCRSRLCFCSGSWDCEELRRRRIFRTRSTRSCTMSYTAKSTDLCTDSGNIDFCEPRLAAELLQRRALRRILALFAPSTPPSTPFLQQLLWHCISQQSHSLGILY